MGMGRICTARLRPPSTRNTARAQPTCDPLAPRRYLKWVQCGTWGHGGKILGKWVPGELGLGTKTRWCCSNGAVCSLFCWLGGFWCYLKRGPQRLPAADIPVRAGSADLVSPVRQEQEGWSQWWWPQRCPSSSSCPATSLLPASPARGETPSRLLDVIHF